MITEKILPSGKTVLNLLDKKLEKSTSSDLESTAGAMSLDSHEQCPKCQGGMQMAVARGETVAYCVECRVTLPYPAAVI